MKSGWIGLSLTAAMATLMSSGDVQAQACRAPREDSGARVVRIDPGAQLTLTPQDGSRSRPLSPGCAIGRGDRVRFQGSGQAVLQMRNRQTEIVLSVASPDYPNLGTLFRPTNAGSAATPTSLRAGTQTQTPPPMVAPMITGARIDQVLVWDGDLQPYGYVSSDVFLAGTLIVAYDERDLFAFENTQRERFWVRAADVTRNTQEAIPRCTPQQFVRTESSAAFGISASVPCPR